MFLSCHCHGSGIGGIRAVMQDLAAIDLSIFRALNDFCGWSPTLDRIVVHLLVELYARSGEEATEVLESAARGHLSITSLAEESRPPASTGDDPH